MPKPYQKPHPPLRVAATTQETYEMVGRLGYPIFVAVRTTSKNDLERFIVGYHEGWKAAGHPGRGQIALTIPVYVAETAREARDEPEASTMHFFRSISRALKQPDGGDTFTSEAREARAQVLGEVSYENVLDQYSVYGTP